MRHLFLTLILGFGLTSLQADDGMDKFSMLAWACSPKNGTLKILPYDDTILWLNNVRQNTHVDVSDNIGYITIKPGDVLIIGSTWVSCAPLMLTGPGGKPMPPISRPFYLYRFDKLTTQRAYFTLSIFDSVDESLGPQTHRYWLGTLKTTSQFRLDLTTPFRVLVEEAPGHLELSWKKPSRSK